MCLFLNSWGSASGRRQVKTYDTQDIHLSYTAPWNRKDVISLENGWRPCETVKQIGTMEATQCSEENQVQRSEAKNQYRLQLHAHGGASSVPQSHSDVTLSWGKPTLQKRKWSSEQPRAFSQTQDWKVAKQRCYSGLLSGSTAAGQWVCSSSSCKPGSERSKREKMSTGEELEASWTPCWEKEVSALGEWW